MRLNACMSLAGLTVGFQGCAEKASHTQQKTSASESLPGVNPAVSREDEQLGATAGGSGLDEKIDCPLDTRVPDLPSVEPGLARLDPDNSSMISKINKGLAELVSGLNEGVKEEVNSFISPLPEVEKEREERTDVPSNPSEASLASSDCNHVNATTDQDISDNGVIEDSIEDENVTVAVSSNSDLVTKGNDASESQKQPDEVVSVAPLPSSTGGSPARNVEVQNEDENTQNVGNEESSKVEHAVPPPPPPPVIASEATKPAAGHLDEIHRHDGVKSLRKAPTLIPKRFNSPEVSVAGSSNSAVPGLETHHLIDSVKANKKVEEEDAESWDAFDLKLEPIIRQDPKVYTNRVSAAETSKLEPRTVSKSASTALGTIPEEWVSRLRKVDRK